MFGISCLSEVALKLGFVATTANTIRGSGLAYTDNSLSKQGWRCDVHNDAIGTRRPETNGVGLFVFVCLVGLLCCVIRTLHDCPSQMNENLLISNSKLTSDSELICWRLSTNLSSFVRDSHVGCVLYNGKDNYYQIRSWIQIMRNVRVLSNHERALLAHPCTFGEKIARFSIFRFKVIIGLHQSQMIIDIVEFTSHESFSVI